MSKKISKKSKANCIYIPTNSIDDVLKCIQGEKILWPTLNGLSPKKGDGVVFGLVGTDIALYVGDVIKANNKCNPYPFDKYTNATWNNKGDANGMLIIKNTNLKRFKKSELKSLGVNIVKGRKQYITIPGLKVWTK